MTTVAPARKTRLDLVKDEVGRLGLLWYEAYAPILMSRAKEVAVFGGVRASKSNVDALVAWILVFFNIQRPLLIWIVGGTYKAAEKEFGYLHEWTVRTGLLRGNASMPDRDSWRMTLVNGTVIETRSGEHPERLASDAPDLILVVEAGKVKPAVRKACRQRAVEKGAQIYYSGTFEEEEDDPSAKYTWFENLDDEFREGTPGWGVEYEKFSLPSWTNLFVFPGGWHDEKIQKEYRFAVEHDDLYTFNRKFAGIPGEVQHAIYPLIQHNEDRLVVPPAGLKFVTLRGGADYGTDHASALTVVGLDARPKMGATDNRGRWSENRDLWVMDGWWDGDRSMKSGERGDPDVMRAERRKLERAFPGLMRWVTDPNERYMAKEWGAKYAPGGAGSREVRVRAVRARHTNMTIWYNRDSAYVRGLYKEQQGVRYKVTSDGQLVNARDGDDRTASLENAVWGIGTSIGRLPAAAKYG